MYKPYVAIDFESPDGRKTLRRAINSWLEGVLLPTVVLKHFCRSPREFNKYMTLREKIIFAWYYCQMLAADEYEDCELPEREVSEFKEKFNRLRRLCELFSEFMDKNETTIRRSLKREIKELQAIPKYDQGE